jgi:hypothetical protein
MLADFLCVRRRIFDHGVLFQLGTAQPGPQGPILFPQPRLIAQQGKTFFELSRCPRAGSQTLAYAASSEWVRQKLNLAFIGPTGIALHKKTSVVEQQHKDLRQPGQHPAHAAIGLGVQSGLLAFRVHAAAQARCRIAVSSTDKARPSLRNLQRCGFTALYQFHHVPEALVLERRSRLSDCC